MTTTSELNTLNHNAYSAINEIRSQNERVELNSSIHKKLIKTMDFEKIRIKIFYITKLTC